jgi:Ran GTPase-activating protein (RanGAP) involved in mRNA processing and transport
LNGRITHFTYLSATEAEEVRADPRVENLCNAQADCPSVYLDNGELSDTSLKAISDVLPFLENVNVISFANTELTDDDVKLLGEGLSKASVHVLKLNNNKISNDGCATLATLLSGNRNLEELDVSGNAISDAGVSALSALFSAKNPLRSLKIESNRIGDKGISDLAAALRSASVPTLKFSKNDIGDAGAAAVASLLKNNSSILHLDLSSNSITDAGVAVLCEVLKTNTSVLTVDLSRNQLTPAAVESIHSLLKANKVKKNRKRRRSVLLLFFKKVIRSFNISENAIAEGSVISAVLNDPSVTISSLAFSRFQA